MVIVLVLLVVRLANQVVERVLPRRMEVEVDVRAGGALLEVALLLASVLVHGAGEGAALVLLKEWVRVLVLVEEHDPQRVHESGGAHKAHRDHRPYCGSRSPQSPQSPQSSQRN